MPQLPANSRPHRLSRRCHGARRSAKFWRPIPPRRGRRSCRICRPITRSNREHGRRAASLRRPSALPLPKARSAKFRRVRASRSAHRVSLPPRAGQPRPPRPLRRQVGRRPAKGAADDKARKPSTISSKIRSLLVGASVVVIVLGTFKMAMTLLDGGSAAACHAEIRASHCRRPSYPRTAASSRSCPSGDASGHHRSGDPFDDVADPDRPPITN